VATQQGPLAAVAAVAADPYAHARMSTTNASEQAALWTPGGLWPVSVSEATHAPADSAAVESGPPWQQQWNTRGEAMGDLTLYGSAAGLTTHLFQGHSDATTLGTADRPAPAQFFVEGHTDTLAVCDTTVLGDTIATQDYQAEYAAEEDPVFLRVLQENKLQPVIDYLHGLGMPVLSHEVLQFDKSICRDHFGPQKGTFVYNRLARLTATWR
jgi:hypothetical protein